MKQQPGPEHVDSLLVALFSAGIMPEEAFDRLALERLQHYGAAGQLAAIKEAMLLHQHAYRLNHCGRTYLALSRLAGDVDGRPVLAIVTAGLSRSVLPTPNLRACPGRVNQARSMGDENPTLQAR